MTVERGERQKHIELCKHDPSIFLQIEKIGTDEYNYRPSSTDTKAVCDFVEDESEVTWKMTSKHGMRYNIWIAMQQSWAA